MINLLERKPTGSSSIIKLDQTKYSQSWLQKTIRISSLLDNKREHVTSTS